MTNTRIATRKLLEMLDDNLLDKDLVINACLSYMSEKDVANMCRVNEFFFEDEQNQGEEE